MYTFLVYIQLGIKKDLTIGNGYRINKTDYWTMIHTADNMKAVYCLEAGAHVSSGDSYKEDSAKEYLNNVKNETLNSDEIGIVLGEIFLYAFTGELNSVEAYYKYTATQLLVWEALVGQRDINFNKLITAISLLKMPCLTLKAIMRQQR